jgi:transposase
MLLVREDAPAVVRKLSRGKVLAFFAQAAPCRVGMEACGSSHYWAREIRALGHAVVLIPPAYTKPYVKRGKNDANDAAAICEAMSRPDMRFASIKSADQQAVLMLHKTRQLLVKQRTMTINALRGHLSEFGLIAPKGIQKVKDLLALALAPSQRSSGGKEKLGAITKKGNRYLRKMLVVGCTSVLRVAHKHKGALAEWILAMRARKPERVVAVALANKLARIAWAMMSTGESFRTELYTKA